MADEREKDGAGLQRLDSDPPPSGSGDAYDAPTKVGEISSAIWKAAQPVRPPMETLETGPPSNTEDTPPNGAMVPLAYDTEEEDHDGATLLHASASKRFSLPPALPPPRVPPPFSTYAAPPQPPPMEPRVPEMVGPGPNDKAWPFAPGLVEPEPAGDRKQAIVVAVAAAIFGVIAAMLIWRWLL